MRTFLEFLENDPGARVSFQLVYGDHDVVLPLALDSVAEERLMGLIAGDEGISGQRADLARKITDAICVLLEWQPTPPSEKQIKYAVAIARELSLTLQPEVLQQREAMTRFLGTHAETYRRRRGR